MADRSTQLVLTALARAAADGAGVPLHGNKTHPGLFPTTQAGKQAAQRCCDEGFLATADTTAPRAGSSPLGTITDKGLTYLLSQVSPRQVLEDFVRTLEARETQMSELLTQTRTVQQSLQGLRDNALKVLHQTARNGDLKSLFQEFRQTPSAPEEIVLRELTRWRNAGAADDYPLPDLFEATKRDCQGLTIGAFHDSLRKLVEANRVYLHPWTGPLYDLPHPPFALMVGHEIAYYASAR